jgi:hypothetical protein
VKNTAVSNKIVVSADGRGIVSQAGGLLLVQTLRVTGLDQGLSAGLARWRKPRAVHDPGKIVADLALTLALGGDCLADIAMLRSQGELYGLVASDPTVSRLVDALAADPVRALKAIRAARAMARERAWALAGEHAPGAEGEPIPVDIDATVVISHSEKEHATATWKKTFGFQCAMRRSGVFPVQPGGTWKEVPGPDDLPELETVRGPEHVRKLAAMPRRCGWCARRPA